SGGPFTQSVIVNVGRRDGVRDGAPARDGLGLVGRVVGVGRRTSRVLLLTDPSSRTPVYVHLEDERRRAILSGDDTAAPLLRYVEGGGAVPQDARVTTSGEGGVFPRGLMIGQVAEGGDGAARVALAADYRNLEIVRIYRTTGHAADTPDGGLILRAIEAETDPAAEFGDTLDLDALARDDAAAGPAALEPPAAE
ncbi:MAG: rod shape-determining protein MreC, partial [Pseudomonadota bacterium]